jgi:exodeoxyribonuclease VII small subunit
MATEKVNLQKALKQLETIVDDLSNKEVDVEAGLEKFKTGVELIKFCRSQLKEAENQFQKLKTELDMEDSGEEDSEDEEETSSEIDVTKITF